VLARETKVASFIYVPLATAARLGDLTSTTLARVISLGWTRF